MAVRSSANENKVFAMKVSEPGKEWPKTLKSGRSHGFAWISGRGDVASVFRGCLLLEELPFFLRYQEKANQLSFFPLNHFMYHLKFSQVSFERALT